MEYTRIKYEKLMAAKPYKHATIPFGIELYEHPTRGDEYPVIAVKDGIAWNTEFFDPWNDTDQNYIIEQWQEIKARA